MTVEQLIEIEKIKRVYAAYSDALDYRNFDDLATVFSDDCIVDYNDIAPDLVLQGNAVVVSAARTLLGENESVRRTHHNMGNFRIDVEGNRAKAIVRFYAVHSGGGNWAGHIFSCWGDYHDQLEKRDDQWCITHRVYRSFVTQGPVEIAGYSAPKYFPCCP